MRRHLLLAALLTAVVGALLVPAAVGAGIRVEGTVRGDWEKPALVVVDVYDDLPDGTVSAVETTATRSDGSFALVVPRAGDYWFRFSDADGRLVSRIVPVEVGDATDVGTIRLQSMGSRIVGTTLDQHGRTFSPDLLAMPVSEGPDGDGIPLQHDHPTTGSFAGTVPAGQYKVRVEGHGWWGGPTWEDATVAEVGDRGADLGLRTFTVPGYVTGRVVDSTGTPLRGVLVTSFLRRSAQGSHVVGPRTTTAADGTYLLGRVNGYPDVRLRFVDQLGDRVTRWNGGARDLSAAVPLDMRATANLDDVDVTLPTEEGVPATGLVRGTIVSESGEPEPAIGVDVIRVADDRRVATAVSRRDGTYVVPELAPGDYRVRFDFLSDVGPILDNGVPAPMYLGGVTFAHLSPVVTVGTTPQTLPTQTMKRHAQIRGRLTVPQSIQDLPGYVHALVEVEDLDGRTVESSLVEDGPSWGVVVPPGRYVVRLAAVVRDDLGTEHQVGRRWIGGWEAGAATVVTVGGKNVTVPAVTLTRTPAVVAPARLSGSATVGSTVRVAVPRWSTNVLRSSVQWYRGTTAIAGATSTSYRPTRADRGKRLVARITVSDPLRLWATASTSVTTRSTVR